MPNRNIIITADDYGMCAAVNEAIDECVALGTITSTNLMVNMPACAAAKTFRRRFPKVALGLHWTICQGVPVLPAKTVPSLVNATGEFHSAGEIRRRWARGLIEPDQLHAELTAQYHRFVDLVGAPDYWNTHQNTHVYPGMFPLFVRAGLQCRIRAMRSHRRVVVPRAESIHSFRIKHPLFFAKGLVISRYSRRAEQLGVWMPRGLIYPSGYDKALEIADILKNPRLAANERPVEFVVHPANQAHPELFGDVVASRLVEYKTLRDPQFLRELAASGVTLCSFAPITPNQE